MNQHLIDIITYYIIPLIGSTFIVYIIIDSVNKLGCNIKINKTVKLSIDIVFVVLVLGLSLFNNTFINFIICVLLYPIIAHFICNNKRIYLIYYLGLTMSIFMLDIILSLVLQMLLLKGIMLFIDERYILILYVLLSRLLSYILAKVYVKIATKKKHDDMSSQQYIASYIFPAFSVVYIYTLLYALQFVVDTNLFSLFVVNVTLILFMNIYFSKITEVTEKNYELKNQIQLYNQQESLQYQYYEDIEKKYQESVRVLHDIRNHIQAMEELYKSSDDTKALEYAQDVHQMLNDLGHKYYTSNRILNIILNDKVRIMNSLKISHQIKIGDVNLDNIKDVDITVIFGNILDNAIEAAAKSLVTPRISLIVDIVQNIISISLSNSISDQPKENNKGLISTKKNHQGVGLKNVERTVNKYYGDIQYKYDENVFVLYIMLPV